MPKNPTDNEKIIYKLGKYTMKETNRTEKEFTLKVDQKSF
jgi:hypothetical protein